MTDQEINKIIERAQEWFYEEVVPSHRKNTVKLKNIKEFKINPFLLSYLTKFSKENITAKNLAETLIYPRAMGSSINTIFGNSMQNFANNVLGTLGSPIPGIDIEYTSTKDRRKKYCQMKAGPETINNPDVETISRHFNETKRRARLNGTPLDQSDLIVGVSYGTASQLNGNYKKLINDHHYTVLAGAAFWEDITGDKNFYAKLINAFADCVAKYELNFATEISAIIDELSKDPYLIELEQYFA